ncbi:MAG: sulfatase-like hydrolase/transferase [Deltaproteobacteria bacterium]|nr:sulfatase-like hydrolase/transferase [Deltaproteobacteria bacterium]
MSDLWRITPGALLLACLSCNGSPVEVARAQTAEPDWQPVAAHDPVPAAAPGGISNPAGPVPVPAAPLLLPDGTRVVAGRLLDSPDRLHLLAGLDRLRPDEEGLAELSYPYPFIETAGPLATVARRLITADLGAQDWDMRAGLLLPGGAALSWDLPAGRARVLHLSAALFHHAFKAQGGASLVLDVAPDAGRGWQRTFSTGESSRAWEEVALPLPDEALSLTVTVRTGGGTGPTRAGVGVADVHVTVPAARDAPAAARRPAPNVIMIFVDALRSDCAGPGNTTFPSVTEFLDDRAGRGTAYTRGFTVANQTRPSIVGFLQSQHPLAGSYHCKWWNYKKEKIREYYARRPPLLPLLLARAGYDTVTFGRNHFQYGTTLMGLDPGFDIVWDNRKAVEDTENIVDRAVSWLDANRDRKFLMLVNISPPHQPYKSPAEHAAWTEERLASHEGRLPARKDYLGEVRYADMAIRRLVEHAEELGLGDRTVFLVTSDHGEVMQGEHACRSELFETICHNSHGLTLYDEELNTPLIWWGHGVVPGRVLSHTVTHLDVAPTVLDLAGLPPHPAHTGLSLWGELRGVESAADRPDVVYVESRLSSAIRAWGWKYILHHEKDDARTPAWNSGGETIQEELYDLTTDPLETRNLARKQDPRRGQLRELLGQTRGLYVDHVARTWSMPWDPDARPPATAAGSTAPAPVAPPARPPSPASTARYHLAFSGDPAGGSGFQGEIRVAGAVASAEVLGPDGSFQVDSGGDRIRVSLELAAGREVLLRFATSPPDAAVTLALTLDGKPLATRQVYTGRDGIALLPAASWTEAEALSVLAAEHPPHRIPGMDPGVFAWRTGPRGAGDPAPPDEDFEKETIVDPTTRGILRDYGYWK